MPNAEMIERWNTFIGERWVQQQPSLDRAYGPHGLAALSAAGLAPGDSVLDVGCGTGALSLEAARRVGERGLVVGVDVSGPMLARARERAAAERLVRTSFERADAQVAPLGTERFDAVVSRLGVMFFDDPVAAFGNLRRSLRRGGRLAFVSWQPEAQNPWFELPERAAANVITLPVVPPGGPGPFSLSNAERVRQILADAGFARIDVAPLALDVSFGDTLHDTAVIVSQFGLIGRALLGADAATASRVLAAVEEVLVPFAKQGAVRMPSAAWLVTATRGSD